MSECRAGPYPEWWVSRGVIDTSSAITNDYMVANAGQLKWLATNACDELEEKLSGGAGSNLWAQVQGFCATNNYLPVNAGQVKNLAQLVWDRLIDEGHTNAYPWAGASFTNDYAVVNIGQLKNAFSFTISYTPGPGDTDGDGLADAWEQIIIDHDPDDDIEDIGDVLPGHDYDGDGLTNLQEYQNGTDPTNSDTTAPTVVIVWPTNAAGRVWIP